MRAIPAERLGPYFALDASPGTPGLLPLTSMMRRRRLWPAPRGGPPSTQPVLRPLPGDLIERVAAGAAPPRRCWLVLLDRHRYMPSNSSILSSGARVTPAFRQVGERLMRFPLTRFGLPL